MAIPRAIIFVDGENLVFRYQDMLAARNNSSAKIVHVPDAFVWHPALTDWCLMDVLRVYFYSSVVGDDDKLVQIREQIGKILYKFQYGPGEKGAAQIVPIIFKKHSRTHKTRQVDIHIAIDMMRFAHNPNIDLLYLVSGDGDYLPLLQEVMRHGKEVYVAALSSGLSSQLRYSVDEFHDLDRVFFPPPPVKEAAPQLPKA
jgi:uncharacterized LabA/DUF88 family protein